MEAAHDALMQPKLPPLKSTHFPRALEKKKGKVLNNSNQDGFNTIS